MMPQHSLSMPESAIRFRPGDHRGKQNVESPTLDYEIRARNESGEKLMAANEPNRDVYQRLRDLHNRFRDDNALGWCISTLAI